MKSEIVNKIQTYKACIEEYKLKHIEEGYSNISVKCGEYISIDLLNYIENNIYLQKEFHNRVFYYKNLKNSVEYLEITNWLFELIGKLLKLVNNYEYTNVSYNEVKYLKVNNQQIEGLSLKQYTEILLNRANYWNLDEVDLDYNYPKVTETLNQYQIIIPDLISTLKENEKPVGILKKQMPFNQRIDRFEEEFYSKIKRLTELVKIKPTQLYFDEFNVFYKFCQIYKEWLIFKQIDYEKEYFAKYDLEYIFDSCNIVLDELILYSNCLKGRDLNNAQQELIIASYKGIKLYSDRRLTYKDKAPIKLKTDKHKLLCAEILKKLENGSTMIDVDTIISVCNIHKTIRSKRSQSAITPIKYLSEVRVKFKQLLNLKDDPFPECKQDDGKYADGKVYNKAYSIETHLFK